MTTNRQDGGGAETSEYTVAGLMELVSEFGQCRWSEGSSGATYLDRVGERRSREEAADLYKQIEVYAAKLGSGVDGGGAEGVMEAPAPSAAVRVCTITDTECPRQCYSGPCKLERSLAEHAANPKPRVRTHGVNLPDGAKR